MRRPRAVAVIGGLVLSLAVGAGALAETRRDQRVHEFATAQEVATAFGVIDRAILAGGTKNRVDPQTAVRQAVSRVPSLGKNPVTRGALHRRAVVVSGMAQRLSSGKEIRVLDSTTTVREVERKGDGVRLVKLAISRPLPGGPTWGEVMPFAVIDESHDGLAAGDIIALDRESLDTGKVPPALRDLARHT